jgi:polyvinyl alcohol dehydrogenase (cytochrome)
MFSEMAPVKRVMLVSSLFLLGACSDFAKEGTSADDVSQQMSGSQTGGEDHPGASLYDAHCSTCHDAAVNRAPHRSFLEMMSPDTMLHVLSDGVMQQNSRNLSLTQKQDVVEYLVGSQPPESPHKPVWCDGNKLGFDFGQAPRLKNWGMDLENSHYIPGSVAALSVDDIPRLSLKWAFSYPAATRARSQPAIAGGSLVVGSQDGTVYSLDQESGCIRWTYRAGAEVRTGITFRPWDNATSSPKALAYFADLVARVYAVDLVTGEEKWQVKVDDHPNATITAQPVYHDGILYVSVSSLEVVPAADPNYPCCSFRGAVVALDALSGAVKWKSYTITEPPVEVGKNAAGTPILAPSGAPVWNSPTIDPKRRTLYVGTGENYSSPAQGSSDAIIAFDMDTGHIRWTRQTTAGDAWNLACMPFIPDHANCPQENGPDVDFASPPIRISIGDREILVAGQKSGDVYGIDPDTGELLWQSKPGRGGNQGGVHFGMATDGQTIYVPMSDYDDAMLPVDAAQPGLFALNPEDGSILWSAAAENVCGDRKDCDPGISAAITAIPGAVFAGHMDGRLRAYHSANGKVIWETNTDRGYDSISGAPAHGGSFGGGSAPLIMNGMVYVNSGYGLYFHMPGNVLLAFSVDGN